MSNSEEVARQWWSAAVEASRHVSTRVEGRARKQGGEVQCGPGVVLTFYRGRGSTVEVVTYDNSWSNGLNTIDG
jgi:hypothetical protein